MQRRGSKGAKFSDVFSEGGMCQTTFLERRGRGDTPQAVLGGCLLPKVGDQLAQQVTSGLPPRPVARDRVQPKAFPQAAAVTLLSLLKKVEPCLQLVSAGAAESVQAMMVRLRAAAVMAIGSAVKNGDARVGHDGGGGWGGACRQIEIANETFVIGSYCREVAGRDRRYAVEDVGKGRCHDKR